MKFTVQSSDDTSAPPRTGRRQSRSLHCNTPALVGAPANSRTATELGSVAFTGHTNGVPSESCSVARFRHCSQHRRTSGRRRNRAPPPRTALGGVQNTTARNDSRSRRGQREQSGRTSKSTQKAKLETGEKSQKKAYTARSVKGYGARRARPAVK